MKTLDLHGVKHENVQREVDVVLWDAINTNINQVEIITGNSETMKEIVKSITNDYGLTIIDFGARLIIEL